MERYSIEGYDKPFYTGITRSWFKSRLKAADIITALTFAVSYVDRHEFRSVAVWENDDLLAAFLLDHENRIWATDGAWSVLQEYHGIPPHFERIPVAPTHVSTTWI